MGKQVEGDGQPRIDAVDGRGSPFPTDPKVYLRSIVLKYPATAHNYQLNSFRERESPRGYFEKFRESGLFRQHAYPQAVLEAERTDDNRLDEKEYEGRLAGFIFEQMAYADMVGWSTSMGRNKVILSPEEVHKFYRILYPDRKVIEGHFGQHSLEGIYQPDGLRINPLTLEVEEALEYKSFRGEEEGEAEKKFNSQYDGYMRQKHRSLRRVLGKSQFTFITPSDFTIEEYHGRRGVQFEVLPVTYGEFGDFVQDTYHDYLNGRKTTLAERIHTRDATPAVAAPVMLVPGVSVAFPTA